MSINKVITWLNKEPLSKNITYHWKSSPKEAKFSSFPEELNEELVGILQKTGYPGLFDHQKSCFTKLLDGHNVILNTETSSGKTLSYTLPVLHYNLSIGKCNALFLFPTKALASDQLNKLNFFLFQLSELGFSFIAEKFDGDTPQLKRTAIRNSVNFLFTNPDMLHIGILPHHTIWEQFLTHLKFVVVDEVHSYRGVFGSHFSNLIRRFRRVLNFYGASPKFILTTATISNAVEFAQKLIGDDFSLVRNDSSAKSEKSFYFYNPPIVDQELGLRSGMINESVPILDSLIENRNQSIVFARSRKTVETTIRLLKDHFPDEDIKFHGYRSGYLANERRSIEAGLRDGVLDLVVSTNALELGIDMGKVDAIIMLGYPGSIASFIQQAGRAGRNMKPSLIILMASSYPMDQFIIRHPEFIREKSPENALINPDNELIVYNHLRCALFELPFNTGDFFGDLPWEIIKPYLDICLMESCGIERSGKYFWVADNYPSNYVSLRSIKGQPIKLINHLEQSQLIGEIDSSSAKKMVYPGAIYSHDGITYSVNDLRLEENTAYLEPDENNFYTEPKIDSRIEILEVKDQRDFTNYIKRYGEIEINEKVIGYSKYIWQTREIIKSEPLDLPSETIVTPSCWMSFNDLFVDKLRINSHWSNDSNSYWKNWDDIRRQVKIRDHHKCRVCGREENNSILHIHHIIPFKNFSTADEANYLENLVTLCPDCHKRAEMHVQIRSGLSGLAYIMTNLSPIYLMCEPHDLGFYYDASPNFNERKPVLLLYDQYPGGAGLAMALFDMNEKILFHSIDFIVNCQCLDGCPSCVGPPGENGRGAKSATLEMIKLMLQ